MTQAPRRPEEVLIAETGLGKFQLEARAGSSAFLIDEPASAGGLGSGPNPYDLLCAALGSCTAMTIRMYAELKKWPLKRVRLSVTHSRRTLAEKDVFERLIRLEGDLSEDQRQRLTAIAERCPVHLTLANGAEIRTSLALPEAPSHEPTGSAEHHDHMEEACGGY